MKFSLLKKIATLLILSFPLLAVAKSNLSHDELRKLQASANQDQNPISQYLFAKELLNANMMEKGIVMLKKSALNQKYNNGKGYEKAQRDLAELYLKNKKYKSAIAWFKKSAKSGNLKSAYVLSTIYRLGWGTEIKKDYNMSLAWMKYAAKNNDSEALRALGQMHMIGFGTQKNEDLAIKYLERSIDKNNYQSMLILGTHYKINKINNNEANQLITKVHEENNNFMADYIYKTNVSGELVNMKLISGSKSDKRKEKASKRNQNQIVTITNRSNLMDEKVIKYYKEMLYNFRTLEQSLNF